MKIRAKNLAGDWVFGNRISYCKLFDGEKFSHVNTVTACRQSPYFDSEGNRIWEFDILDTAGKFSLVYREFGEWLIGDPRIVKAYGLYTSKLKFDRNAKVVGNIFDNPNFFERLSS